MFRQFKVKVAHQKQQDVSESATHRKKTIFKKWMTHAKLVKSLRIEQTHVNKPQVLDAASLQVTEEGFVLVPSQFEMSPVQNQHIAKSCL